MTVIATPAQLEPAHAEVVSATLPLIGAHIDEITTEFYRGMFDAHPELLRNLFNRGNQAQGAQQRALAASIATFATHLVDPDLPHPAELLSRIGHKHASLGILPDQYSIVHEHLFAAIVAVLGADTVTADVAAAWDRVYWIMADTLIALEKDLYRGAGVADGDVYRRARVQARVDDPSGAVLVTVVPSGQPFPDFLPGQYVSVGVTMPDGARQLRQYSLVNAAGSGELTFAVRPVAAVGEQPAGEVSNWIAANICVGDVLDVTVPFGDLPAPDGAAPLVLISAGIGVTPMIGFLEHLAAHAPDARVQVLHADRSDQSHPLRERQSELVKQLTHASLDIWYEDGLTAGNAGVHAGLMNVAGIDLADDVQVYLCGGNGFVQAVRTQLLDKGVTAERVHCELFSPNDWLLG
ncbi:6,7-dihydropteridine reductase [Mycolicibacterium canariasense]|uniref:nitric oxide dioxygenase n=1 Tax=Mycolicibacterium canariasense TaxID=228230 RepID=A0A117IAT9_MYCCR|nr:globin domain-containing protein [Mycolicibacterium canariasense]MCV7210668.1 hemin transporter [Mycolicibacterium canariasense]ORV07588.1 hemin transporter [Mycolicibacterium canariasense]GAS96904.1 6,7-dihydropteridine reductase [Mycolicibacterium canariasense]